MKHTTLKQNVLTAILIALTVSLSILITIPIPATNGFITPCEVGIYTSALLFGRKTGLLVGGASGFLIDILTGYPIWCLFSLLIHGLQGFAVGHLAFNKPRTTMSTFFALFIGSIIMVGGYCIATTLLFGWPAGLASIFSNTIQVVVGMVVSHVLVDSLAKFNVTFS